MENALAVIILSFLAYYFILILSFVKHRPTNNPQIIKREFISVIIPVRNEEKNIAELLKILSDQDYDKDKYEIITVDDHSTDGTHSILQEFKKEIPNLIVLKNSENPTKTSGKKSALEYGIKNSKGEIILLTDADCRPAKKWISSLSKYFSEDTAAVIGFAPFETKKNFLNHFIRYENLKSSFLMKAFFNLGFPYLSFGRNFAYRKNTFFELDGFRNIKQSLSGDDDLLLQQIRRLGSKILLAEDPDSIVISKPTENFKKYINQKIRHLSASKFYSNKIKLLLGIFYLGNIFSLFVLFYSIIRIDPVLFILSCVKIFFDGFAIIKISKKIVGYFLIPTVPIFEIIFNFYLIIVGIFSRTKKIVWE